MRGGCAGLIDEPVAALARVAMAVDVVCFDKTETLSENRVRVTKLNAAPSFSDRDALTCAAQATPSPDDNGHHAHATDAAVIEAAGDT